MARYSHTSHIHENSPKQKLLLVLGGVVLDKDPASDLAVVSMETWTLLRRVRLDQGVPRDPIPLVGHTSHVNEQIVTSSKVILGISLFGGGSNCFSFGTSFTKSPTEMLLFGNAPEFS